MAAGMREVAKRAGVSVATVSNVLNQPQIVAEPTQNRVREAMRELGFVRNGSARQLRAGRSNVVCLMVPGLSAYFDELATGAEKRAAQNGLALFLCSTHDDPVKEESYLRVLTEQRVRGILVTRFSEVFLRPDISPTRHVPVVLVDLESPLRDHCSTSVDDEHGGELAARHLHELGHRRIAWVGPSTVPQIASRAHGVRKAADALGMQVIDIETSPRTIASVGREAARELHRVGVPTGVICANDLTAVGMETELISLGYSIPHDVSIVGFDDIEFAGSSIVPLTTLARHPSDLGAGAIDLLLAGCGEDDHKHKQIVLPSKLVVRQSTGPPRSGV
jgi:LacI family transcriptional regulator